MGSDFVTQALVGMSQVAISMSQALIWVKEALVGVNKAVVGVNLALVGVSQTLMGVTLAAPRPRCPSLPHAHQRPPTHALLPRPGPPLAQAYATGTDTCQENKIKWRLVLTKVGRLFTHV